MSLPHADCLPPVQPSVPGSTLSWIKRWPATWGLSTHAGGRSQLAAPNLSASFKKKVDPAGLLVVG